MPVSMLMSIISRREYLQWIAYFTHKNPDETEIQLAILSSLVATGLGDKKSTPDKFMINKPAKTTEQVSAQDIMGADEVCNVFAGIAVPME